jgi:hypothetical protein
MAIQQITIAGSIVSDDVLTLDSIDYGNLIGANEHVTDWFTATPSRMTLVDPIANGGNVTSIASRRVGSTATLAANPPTTQRPNFATSDAHFRGRGSVLHDSGGTGGDVLAYSGTFPLGADFFKLAIVYFATAPTLAYLGLSSDTTGNRHLFTATASSFLMRVGASGTEAQATKTFRTGWTCVIGTWNEALKRARVSIDLGATWGTATNASAVADVTTGYQIGKSSDFYWSDQMWGDIDLSDDSDEANDLLLAISNYVTEIVQPAT